MPRVCLEGSVLRSFRYAACLILLIVGVGEMWGQQMTDFEGAWYIASNGNAYKAGTTTNLSYTYNSATPETNFYLRPAADPQLTDDETDAFFDGTAETKPFLTSNNTGHTDIALWILEKTNISYTITTPSSGVDYYYTIRHVETGKYLVCDPYFASAGTLGDKNNSRRKAMHLETKDWTTTIPDKALFKIRYTLDENTGTGDTFDSYCFIPKRVENKTYKYLNLADRNQPVNYGTKADLYYGGLAGLYTLEKGIVDINSRFKFEPYEQPTITFNNATNEVTITATEGSIYYTTNGDTPTSELTAYSSPVTFTQTTPCTIKAIAVKSWSSGVEVSSKETSYNLQKVATPTISLNTNEVTIQCETDGASIYYTTDGTTPSSSSTLYFEPITVTNGDVVKAFAVKDGLIDSEVVTYIVGYLLSAPTINYDNSDHSFTISYDAAILAKDDVHILYTTDGSDPRIGGLPYNSPVTISKNYTVKAVVVRYGEILSNVASEEVVAACFEPTFTYDPSTKKVTIETETEDATIYYTINGEDPTGLEEEEYTEPITIKKGDVVKAFAKKTGLYDSEVATYTFMLPVISYDYTTGKVSITIDMEDASIYYTTNGNDPTSASTPYTEPFAITNGTVVKAIAIKGTDESEIAVFTCAIPTIAYDPTTRMATITPSAEGATIYYTINGGEPTSANNTYTGPFYVEDGETIRAKDDGESAVLTVVLTPIITLSETSYTYDKTAKTPTVESVKIGDTVIPTSEYTYSYSNNTNAGNATVTISNNSGGNYYVSGTKTFTINKKEVGLTWVESLPYNGTQQIPTVTATDLISGDECNVTVTIPGQHRNAGNYTATASALSNPNYQLPTERTHSFTITPRVADLQWATSTLTYNGQAQKPTATVSNRVEGDVCSVTVTGEQTNAGTYTATASALSNPNYQLPANVTTSFTINKATVNTNVTITGWKYNSTPNNPSVTRNPGNGSVTYAYKVKDADDNTYTTTVPTNAGEYTVRATIAETDNYLEATPTANFTIAKIDRSPKPTITINNRTYDGTNTAPTYSVNDNTENGEVTLEYKGDDETNWQTAPPTDAGHYQVRATIAATTNYNASVVMGDYRINKAEINPTLTITGWTYNKPGTITVSENPENGEVQYLYRQLEATPAKSYNTETGKLTLTTTLTGATIYYTTDETNPTSSSTPYTEPFNINAANVDDVKAIAITTTSSFRSYVPTEVGKYEVQATIEDTKNYNGKVVVAEFTIGPTDIDPAPTVILDGWTYGESPKSPYVDGNKGGGKVSYAYKVKDADNATYTATIPTNAGEYTVRATIDATNNYNSTTVTTNFTIAKADLSPAPLVHIDNWTYGGTASTPAIINNAGGGDVTYTYSVKGANSYSETVPTDAGDYTLKATIAGSTNYNSTVATRDFTINKATVTIIITDNKDKKVYGESDPTFSISYEGLATGEDFSGSVTRASGENAGSYAFSCASWDITKGGTSTKDNYNTTLSFKPASFTITPKSIGDGITPADGFTLTISQTAGNWTVNLKKGDTPLNSSTDYNLTQYTRSIDGESYINSDEVDVVFDITGKGNYTGEVKGAKSAPRFYKYDEDTEKDYYITVYRNGSTADWLKPEEGPTAYTITSINLSRRELAITPLAYYPMGVPIVLMMETTHSAPAPNGYEVEGMKGESTDPEKISSAEKQRNLLKVSEGVLSDPADPASAKVPEHVAAAQVYIYNKDKGEFVLALEGDLPIGTFYIDNPNYKPVEEGGGGGTPAPQRLRIVRWNDTPVHDIERDDNYNNDSWYTIDGRRLQGEPTQHGIYLHNGKKVMMK